MVSGPWLGEKEDQCELMSEAAWSLVPSVSLRSTNWFRFTFMRYE
jgi:hypothetical protein